MSTAPTHGHHTDYAEPVLRAPSPASSVGTSYGADQTSYSDSEFQLSQPAFERKCYELIGLSLPRKEELRADRDPLLTVPGPNGRPMRLSEKKLEPAEEKLLHERILASLRAEVAQLRENELFEQILLRGSKAALDVQPVTSDIDALMRSMMGPGLNLSAGPHLGKITKPVEPSNRPPATTGPGIANGPWNDYGEPSEAERRYSALSMDNMLSGTTAGKRSRNGTARKAGHSRQTSTLWWPLVLASPSWAIGTLQFGIFGLLKLSRRRYGIHFKPKISDRQ